MNVSVTFRHLPSSDALRDYVEQKLGKLSKYLFEPIHIHTVLSVEKIRQIVEITLNAKNYRTHVIEESQNMYSSIDMALDKIERQVRRHKEKLKNHKGIAKPSQAIEESAAGLA